MPSAPSPPRLSSPSLAARAPRDASARAHASARGALGSSARLSSPGASIASPRGFLALDRAMPATTPSTRRRATRSGTAVRAADGDAAPAASTGGPKINLPTALTLVRVAAVPLVTVIFYMQGAWVAPTCCAIFVLAAVTDWLDGYLARKMNLVSSSARSSIPSRTNSWWPPAVLLCESRRRRLGHLHGGAGDDHHRTRDHDERDPRVGRRRGGEAHKAVAVNSFGKWKTRRSSSRCPSCSASGTAEYSDSPGAPRARHGRRVVPVRLRGPRAAVAVDLHGGGREVHDVSRVSRSRVGS